MRVSSLLSIFSFLGLALRFFLGLLCLALLLLASILLLLLLPRLFFRGLLLLVRNDLCSTLLVIRKRLVEELLKRASFVISDPLLEALRSYDPLLRLFSDAESVKEGVLFCIVERNGGLERCKQTLEELVRNNVTLVGVEVLLPELLQLAVGDKIACRGLHGAELLHLTADHGGVDALYKSSLLTLLVEEEVGFRLTAALLQGLLPAFRKCLADGFNVLWALWVALIVVLQARKHRIALNREEAKVNAVALVSGQAAEGFRNRFAAPPLRTVDVKHSNAVLGIGDLQLLLELHRTANILGNFLVHSHRIPLSFSSLTTKLFSFFFAKQKRERESICGSKKKVAHILFRQRTSSKAI